MISFQVGANDGEVIAVSLVTLSSVGPDVHRLRPVDDHLRDRRRDRRGLARPAATFGAVQNRLEHTLAVQATYQENLTAAECRIRDVDMAEEMTKLTKDQILQQAGTAMLAQANQAPQTVLSLLK